MNESPKNIEDRPKYETCQHVESIGQLAVYVTPGCPRAEMLKGYLISSKWRCKECRAWKQKG